jgi:hypothetical protein
MPLDAAHHRSVSNKLVPILGDEDTDALMSLFVPGEQLATKADLQALGRQVATDLAQMETRLTVRIGAVAVAQITVLSLLRVLF